MSDPMYFQWPQTTSGTHCVICYNCFCYPLENVQKFVWGINYNTQCFYGLFAIQSLTTLNNNKNNVCCACFPQYMTQFTEQVAFDSHLGFHLLSILCLLSDAFSLTTWNRSSGVKSTYNIITSLFHLIFKLYF